MQQRIEGAWGQQDEMCCDAGTLALCKMPTLLLWKSALSLVLAILPADILRSANRLLLFPDRFVIPFFLFIMGITLVLACLPACLHGSVKLEKFRVGENPAFCSAGGGSLAKSVGISLHVPFNRRKHLRATDSCILHFLLPTDTQTYYCTYSHDQSIIAVGVTLAAGTTWRSSNTMRIAPQPDEYLSSASQRHG